MALWGGAFKLLWLAKPLVYCGFGASKGDTLCGIVFWSFCKGSVIETPTCFVYVSFCVWGCLCLWDPLPRSCKRELSCEGSLSSEEEKRQ